MEIGKMSVVVATYDENLYEDLRECISSILYQDYANFELLIVTENNEIKKRIKRDFEDKRIRIIDFEGEGIAEARNRGGHSAVGEYIVFTDDDIVAERDWLSKIKKVYDENDCLGVSGKVEPKWEEGCNRNIPEEFYWLIGATHRGYGNEGTVRNPFGPNMSFKKNIFEKLNGFDENLGKEKSHMMQGEESEFGSRMRQELGRGVYYDPRISIKHRVKPKQTKSKTLLLRAFYQGYSKGYMSDNTFESGLEKEEVGFLKNWITKYLPEHITNLDLKKSILSLSLTFMVISGFIYYKITSKF